MSRKLTWVGAPKFGLLGALAFASALVFASTPSHALTFDFSITDITVGTTITGEIDGLQDNTANQPATAIIVDSIPPAFNLTTPFSVPLVTPIRNSFIVEAGAITLADFIQSFQCAGTTCNLDFSLGLSGFSEALPSNTINGFVSFSPVASVPGPIAGAGLPGLIAACGVLLLLARRRQIA